MNVTLEYRRTIYSMVLAPVGHLLSSAYVVVKSDDCSLYETFPADRAGYAQAERFIRLMERGYAPAAARFLNKFDYLTEMMFSAWFDKSLHDKLTDERVDITLPDGVEMMFTDPLTPADEERLYKMWLNDGDEIFHFCPDLAELWDIPALLASFRTLAQKEDDGLGSWFAPHHNSLVSY